MGEQLFIGGRWVQSQSEAWIDVENPATQHVIARVPAGSAADADAAVASARRAFDAWAATPRENRAGALESLRDLLVQRQQEMAALITSEMGAPAKLAMGPQTRLPIEVLSFYAHTLRDEKREERVVNSLVDREPVGVVAAITPWNYPLHQAVAKIAPALAAGCTVVHKPSELTPLSALLFAELVEQAGFPLGVYNVVTGTGTDVGEVLAAHPGVDMVSFTGSTRAGRRVAALAAETVKRVTLELGGKSPNLILEDADLAAAVKVGVANCFLNSGQTCTAWSRMLVPDSLHEEAVQHAVDAAERYTLGDPNEPGTRLGPLVSAAQRERVLKYIEGGVADGAVCVTGGSNAEVPSPGYFVAPTVFDAVTPEMTIAREEIFGPVLSILAYEDESDAVRIANDTMYGLGGAVWSRDQERALRVARQLRTGQVDINGAPFNPLAPFGGYKQSGTGRELGMHGLEEFLLSRSIQLP